jgi:hypothetical protein
MTDDVVGDFKVRKDRNGETGMRPLGIWIYEFRVGFEKEKVKLRVGDQ